MVRTVTTIQDIAKHANVSKSTVSRVMNNSSAVHEEKRRAVLDAMKTLGFEPNVFARGLAGGQSMTIGVVMQMIGSPFYDTVTQGIIDALAGTGYSPIIADGQWQQQTELQVIRTLLGRRVDGLILVGGDLPASQLAEIKQSTPTILVGCDLPGCSEESVCVDNVAAAYQAIGYLLECGHRQIAHICGIKHHVDAIQRLEGYTKALEDAGARVDPDLIFEGDFSAQSGMLAINAFLAKGKNFTAVFAANDMTAFGARLALYRKGIRVPEDMSIIGFDDQAESAYMTPPLTTVRQPAAEMGVAAANALLHLIKGESFEVPKLKTELMVRESVAQRR